METKKQIAIRLPQDLWKAFRLQLFKDGLSAQEFLEGAVRDYLKSSNRSKSLLEEINEKLEEVGEFDVSWQYAEVCCPGYFIFDTTDDVPEEYQKILWDVNELVREWYRENPDKDFVSEFNKKFGYNF